LQSKRVDAVCVAGARAGTWCKVKRVVDLQIEKPEVILWFAAEDRTVENGGYGGLNRKLGRIREAVNVESVEIHPRVVVLAGKHQDLETCRGVSCSS
jgi:hypothetical protein